MVSVFAGTQAEAGLCQIPSAALSTAVLNSTGTKNALKIPADNSNNSPHPTCLHGSRPRSRSLAPSPSPGPLCEKEARGTYLHTEPSALAAAPLRLMFALWKWEAL